MIGIAQRVVQIVQHDHEAALFAPVEHHQQIQDFERVGDVEMVGRLVEDKEVRPVKGGKPMVSAFDRFEPYELTELGKQFVHYAMNELAPRLEYDEAVITPEDGVVEGQQSEET